MRFVKNGDLKIGMRLAKPVYDKKGVLLYDRDSKLTQQGIDSVKNFGLIGLYILEPAEPLPPMTEEDIEFERFQMVSVFAIQEELNAIRTSGKAPKMQIIASNIIKNYGRLEHKVNFVQSLRSHEDYIYKHALNVAILCAMITHVMNVKLEEQLDTVIAAIVHDVGKLSISKEIREKEGKYTAAELLEIENCERSSADMAEAALASPKIKRMIVQSWKGLYDWKRKKTAPEGKIVMGAKILMVAETFDTMTAMNHYQEPSSEVMALRYLMQHPEIFDKDVVDALVKSVNILAKGCCVELTNGDKGLVIQENEFNILKPVILCFRDNQIVDLSHNVIYEDMEIKDVMKTMDNRCVMDPKQISELDGKGQQDA